MYRDKDYCIAVIDLDFTKEIKNICLSKIFRIFLF
jgi:hypothetical protein